MELKEHEQIVLSDFDAQLEVIRRNILVANDELTNALKTKDKVNELSASIRAQIVKEEESRDSLIKDIESKKAAISVHQQIVQDREDNLNEREKSFESYKEKANLDIEGEVSKANKYISSLKLELDTLDKDIVENSNELTSIKASLDASMSLLNSNIETLNGQSFEISKNKDKIDDLNKDFIRVKAEKDLELENIERLIQVEIEKVKIPRENLEREQKDVSRMANDNQILFARLRKYYKALGMEINL